MKCPMINTTNLTNNSITFEPSDDDLQKIEEEVDKLLNEQNNEN